MFDTIAAESQRLINETYSAFVQGFVPSVARADVDLLEGLTTAIIVDHERMGANARSTVATATDANAMLRILFTRLGEPRIGGPSAFACNVPSLPATGSMTFERGKNVSEVLEMPVAEAKHFFDSGDAKVPAAHAVLKRLDEVGLGYLSVGQPLTTLSGGERQRLKLAIHMAEKGGIYLLDEVTSGLHLADVQHLLVRLVDEGKSVIVIENHQAVKAFRLISATGALAGSPRPSPAAESAPCQRRRG